MKRENPSFSQKMQKPKVGHKGAKEKIFFRAPTSCKNISKIEREGT
jgi:hypothetical protein